jgi:hypothetical protein
MLPKPFPSVFIYFRLRDVRILSVFKGAYDVLSAAPKAGRGGGLIINSDSLSKKGYGVGFVSKCTRFETEDDLVMRGLIAKPGPGQYVIPDFVTQQTKKVTSRPTRVVLPFGTTDSRLAPLSGSDPTVPGPGEYSTFSVEETFGQKQARRSRRTQVGGVRQAVRAAASVLSHASAGSAGAGGDASASAAAQAQRIFASSLLTGTRAGLGGVPAWKEYEGKPQQQRAATSPEHAAAAAASSDSQQPKAANIIPGRPVGRTGSTLLSRMNHSGVYSAVAHAFSPLLSLSFAHSVTPQQQQTTKQTAGGGANLLVNDYVEQPFLSTATRFQPSVSAVPAPGQYFPAPDALKPHASGGAGKGHSSLFRSKTRARARLLDSATASAAAGVVATKPNDVPGPGTYTPDRTAGADLNLLRRLKEAKQLGQHASAGAAAIAALASVYGAARTSNSAGGGGGGAVGGLGGVGGGADDTTGVGHGGFVGGAHGSSVAPSRVFARQELDRFGRVLRPRVRRDVSPGPGHYDPSLAQHTFDRLHMQADTGGGFGAAPGGGSGGSGGGVKTSFPVHDRISAEERERRVAAHTELKARAPGPGAYNADPAAVRAHRSYHLNLKSQWAQ